MIHLAFLIAAAEPTQTQVIGVGANSCGSFVDTRTQPFSRGIYVQWLVGFLMEFNITNRQGILDAMGHTDKAGVEAWLDTYCSAHPLIPFATASEALLVELSGLERRAQGRK